MAGRLGRLGVVVISLVAVAQCLPLWRHYWFSSHEGFSYVLRVIEFEAGLRQGDFYPRWAADFYGGYGSPFFVFYAPLAYAGSAIGSAVLGSAVLGLKLWIALASIAAGSGLYAAVEGETRRVDAALLAALLYLGSSYRLTDIYVRGDVAEYTALALLPWAVWGYRRIGRALLIEDGVRPALLTVVAHAGMLFSHAILALWGTLLLGALCLAMTLALWRRQAQRRIALLWTVFGLALAVASLYLGPALLQKRYVHIGIAVTDYYDPLNQLLPLRRLLFIGQYGLLPVVFAALAAALIALLMRRVPAALPWAVTALGLALLSTSYAEPFWGLRLPLTSFIQFPWRLHGPASLAAALAVGIAWAAVLRSGWWRLPLAFSIGAAVVLSTASLCDIPYPYARGSFPETTSEIREGLHHTTADEYLPSWVAAGPKAPASSLLSRANQVEMVGSFSQGAYHELELLAEHAGQVELSLHMFPGWRVDTLAGPATVLLSTSRAGLVALSLPVAGRYRVRVNFGTSPVRAAFGALSLMAALASWPLLRYLTRPRPLSKLPSSAIPATELRAA